MLPASLVSSFAKILEGCKIDFNRNRSRPSSSAARSRTTCCPPAW